MKFAVLGWSYRQTPVELREKIALTPQQRFSLAYDLKQQFELEELLILSTCNRTEFYYRAVQPRHVSQQILKYLTDFWKNPDIGNLSYQEYDMDAVRHLFRVSASLDSMILGEPQILGQIKDAYQEFQEMDMTGSVFKSLFPKAFFTAKRVRTETQISNFAVSISFAAVELARQIFDDLEKRSVMIIGAGEMAELSARHLIKCGVSRLLVTNRTFANAVKMAERYKGSAIQFEQMAGYLPNVDIVISSTGASHHIITESTVKKCMKLRKGDPMFFIDIAVPRDIDPQINNISDVFCYDIDDLQNVVDRNLKERQKEAQLADHIVEEEIIKTHSWFKTLSSVPTLKALRKQFHDIGEDELFKTLSKLKGLDSQQQDAVKYLVYKIINRLLHAPSTNLKEASHRDDVHLYLEALSDLFDLSPAELSIENLAETPVLKLLNRR
ncbi:MAG: glutamyl-tRNA reductase [SAR324 cluster bacterium]|nr:glutamyl-tRNA reductase [SAR324 cluster bacterium]